MLQPKKTKYRKNHRARGKKSGKATRGVEVSFGDIGLKSTSAGELSSRQIEAARRTITRSVKRGGKVWIRVFPDKNLTSKSGELPMGKGKGAPSHWVAQVYPGTMLFEMAGVDEALAREALSLASYKLGVSCRIATKEI